MSKEIHKDSIGAKTKVTCTVSEISSDPKITWSISDNGNLGDEQEEQFSGNQKTSIMEISLESAKDTDFNCTVVDSNNLLGAQQIASLVVYGKYLREKAFFL